MSSEVSNLVFECALALVCLAAHESGHILAARICGIRVKKVGIRWMGVYIQRARSTGWREVAVCISGPLVNLALALAFWHMAPWFGLCNLVIGAVNLLPISHSDGSHALEAWEAMQTDES